MSAAAAVYPRGYRILVVDDDPDFRESEAKLLRSSGYEVAEASNPDDAKAILTQADRSIVKPFAFHLSLLDNRMPDSTGTLKTQAGLELASWIKETHPYTSRIIFTSLEDTELVKKAIREGLVDDYYNKNDVATGRVAGLLDTVKQTLRNRLTSVLETSEFPHRVDILHFWGEEGVVEQDIVGSGFGGVRFQLGLMRACIGKGAYVMRIAQGTKVLGRIVRGGLVEVVHARIPY